jgi:N-acetylglucosaminyldiphosphoundecaprenol N-acetyl-beta-D-mannosaminyltransferase
MTTLTAARERLDSRRERVFPRVDIGGVPTDLCGRDCLKQLLLEDVRHHRTRKGAARLIFDVNGHGVSLFASNAEYRNAVLEADVIHADGQPIVWASRMAGVSGIPERTATTDLIHDIATVAVQHDLRLFLLGSQADVVAHAAQALRAKHPGLQICGVRHGYFRDDEQQQVVAEIAAKRPDVVIVGMGKPREQMFAISERENTGAAWIVTAGGCFDYFKPSVRRAPAWMQFCGMEWLFRLLQEPRRLFMRYATTNPHAAWLILTRTNWRELLCLKHFPRAR